jgi:hypothetical protein
MVVGECRAAVLQPSRSIIRVECPTAEPNDVASIDTIAIDIDLIVPPLAAAFLHRIRSLVGIVDPRAGAHDVSAVNAIVVTIYLVS